MASFEIADCPTKLPLTETAEAGGRTQKGTLTLTVRNNTDRARTGRMVVNPQGVAKPAWFAFDGAPPTSAREIEHDFDAKGSTTVRVNVSVPAGEAPGSHILSVRVTAEDDPDNDFVVGPNVGFDVAAWTQAPPPREKFPWWAVAVAAVLVVVVGGAVAYLLLRPTGAKIPEIIGMPWNDAKPMLDLAGISHGDPPRDIIHVILPANRGLAGRVIAVDPKEGQRVESGRKVDVFTQAGIDPFFCRACDNRRFADLPPTTQALVEEGVALARARHPEITDPGPIIGPGLPPIVVHPPVLGPITTPIIRNPP